MGATHLDETRPLPETRPYEMILEFTRAKKAEDPYSFHFEPQKYRLRMKGGVTKSAKFPWSEHLLEDLRTLTQAQPAPEAAKRLGEHLRRFLDELDWGGHEHVLERSGRRKEELRVIIRSAAAELYALPWELVTLKDSGQHLADLPGCTVSYEWPTERGGTARSPVPERGRVLFAWSMAGDLVPVERHLRSLEQACQKAGLAFDEQDDTLPKVTLSSLEERLSNSPEPISVLHVLCHGTALETEDSGAYGLVWNSSVEGRAKEIVDGARLSALLAPYSDTLKLVVLCACHGGDGGKMASYLGSVAQEIHRAGIEVVVASRLPLSSAGSVLMTETLYQKLLVEARSLEESLCAARRRLRVAGNGFDWAALQFYARTNQPFFFGRREQKEEPRVPTPPQSMGNAASIWLASLLRPGTTGLVGEPSEGAMAAAAKMASIQDVPVMHGVALTGIINPDGGIGPVAGLLQRLQDVATASKRTFGYPAGQRHDRDEVSGQLVDLHEPAQEHNVALQEVRDIYEAYELLTGQKLSRPQPVDSLAMNLSPTALQRMQAKTSAMLAWTESSLAQLKQPGPYTPALEPALAMAGQGYTLAVRSQANGLVPAAYFQALNVTARAEAALNLLRILDKLARLDIERMNLDLQALASVEADCHAFGARLGTGEPRSVAHAMELLGAYESVAIAWAATVVAKSYMAGCAELFTQLIPGALSGNLEQVLHQLGEKLMGTCTFFSIARVQLNAGADMLEFRAEQEQQAMLRAPPPAQLAQAYASAARANLDSYLALFTQAETRQAGQSPVSTPSDALLITRTLLDRALLGLQRQEPVLFCLAAARSAYLHSAQFLTRKYSLMVEEDESGNAVTVRREKAFATMLEWAEHKALELAAEARETTGGVPVLTQLAYQRARAQCEGSTEDKLNALGCYWDASLASQIAVALATSNHEPLR